MTKKDLKIAFLRSFDIWGKYFDLWIRPFDLGKTFEDFDDLKLLANLPEKNEKKVFL